MSAAMFILPYPRIVLLKEYNFLKESLYDREGEIRLDIKDIDSYIPREKDKLDSMISSYYFIKTEDLISCKYYTDYVICYQLNRLFDIISKLTDGYGLTNVQAWALVAASRGLLNG